jgi:hypothetical protein
MQGNVILFVVWILLPHYSNARSGIKRGLRDKLAMTFSLDMLRN